MERVERTQPKGICWAGRTVPDSSIVVSEAWYQLTKVSEIVSEFIKNDGNVDRAASALNKDYFANEEVYMTNKQIKDIVDWSANNPTYMIYTIKND